MKRDWYTKMKEDGIKRWRPCTSYCQMTGAAAAFLSVSGCHVLMNSPRWCAILAERELAKEQKEYEQRLFCSEVLEPDLLYGVCNKVTAALEELSSQAKPTLLAVLTSCSLSLIGDDLKGICRAASTNSPVIALDAGGLSGEFTNGWGKAVLALLKQQCLQKQSTCSMSVNLIGFSTVQSAWKDSIQKLQEQLAKAQIKVNCCLLTNNTQLSEVQNLGQAQLNLVLDKELGLPVAEWLQQNLQQPYIILPEPILLEHGYKWLDDVLAFRCRNTI